MKLLIAASGDYYSSYGGGQVYVRRLVASLVETGHEVTVFSMITDRAVDGVSNTRDEQCDGACVRSVQLGIASAGKGCPLELNPAALQAAVKAIRDFKPDCVHANGWKATFAKACHNEGIACVITAHHGGIVCPAGSLLNADDEICTQPAECSRCLQCCLRKHPGSFVWRGILGVLPHHSRTMLGAGLELIPNIPFVSPALKQPLHVQQHLKRISALRRYGQAFIAPSEAIGRALIRNGVDCNRVTVVHHGIPPYGRRPFEPGLGQRPVRFGYVGRVNRVKGYHVLIDAFSQLIAGSAELHVIGDAHTKWEKRYSRRVHRMWPVSGITVHGHVGGSALAEKVAACDVIILPSICLEVFGLVIPEAFSLGRPVIVTKCGGPEELVRDGQDGLVVDRNVPEALANAMQSLIAKPGRIKAMARSLGPVRTMADHAADLEMVYRAAIDGNVQSATC